MIGYILSYKGVYLPVYVQRNGSRFVVIVFDGLLCLPNNNVRLFKKFPKFHVRETGKFQVMFIPPLR